MNINTQTIMHQPNNFLINHTDNAMDITNDPSQNSNNSSSMDISNNEIIQSDILPTQFKTNNFVISHKPLIIVKENDIDTHLLDRFILNEQLDYLRNNKAHFKNDNSLISSKESRTPFNYKKSTRSKN